VMVAHCPAEVKAVDEKACSAIREDGAYIDAGENDNLIVQKLETNPAAVGIFGFSFLDQNSEALKGATIGGVAPTFEAIAAGEYPVSRSLYFYIKKEHVGVIPGLAEFAAEFVSDAAAGEEGYLTEKGLIPLPADQLAAARDAAANLTPVAKSK
jgi:phosphate transport system substrate-binding protein